MDAKIYLNAVRANAQMTQREWAVALGVDKSTVCNWEKAKSEPNASQLRRMSELSGIPMANIYLCKNDDKIDV